MKIYQQPHSLVFRLVTLPVVLVAIALGLCGILGEEIMEWLDRR